MGDGLTAALSMIGTLLLMVAVFVGAYYASRYIGKKYQPNGSGGNLHVLDRLSLGREQTLLLVRVGSKVLLLGCTGKSVEKLDELDPSEFEEESEPHDREQFINTWKTILKNYGEGPDKGIEDGKEEQL